MTLIAFLKTFKVASSSINTAVKILKDESTEFLKTIAQHEIESAIIELEDSKKSNDQNREIGNAIGKLKTAHIRIFHSIKSDLISKLLTACIGPLSTPENITANLQCFQLAMLIAFCYKKLDDIQLMDKYISTANQHFNDYADAYIKYQMRVGIYCTSRENSILLLEDNAKEKIEEGRKILSTICNDLKYKPLLNLESESDIKFQLQELGL